MGCGSGEGIELALLELIGGNFEHGNEPSVFFIWGISLPDELTLQEKVPHHTRLVQEGIRFKVEG